MEALERDWKELDKFVPKLVVSLILATSFLLRVFDRSMVQLLRKKLVMSMSEQGPMLAI